MRIVMIGPNGAGKGTQAELLSDRYRAPHVATGILLRAAVKGETELGKRATAYMEAGELVPDELVLAMLRERLEEPDAQKGFILDGYPRNAAQADALAALLGDLGCAVDAVVNLKVPDELVVQRLSSRASCPTCGRSYTLVEGKPDACEIDQTPLAPRSDDQPEVILRRLQIFREQTQPLIQYYDKQGCLVEVDGVGSVEEVHERIVAAIESL